jgi:hypothetical protein
MCFLKSSNLIRFLCAGAVCCASLTAQRQGGDLGFTDTPMLPGQKWHVHDVNRPYAPVVTPADIPATTPPSDAIVLFDGKNLSKWLQKGRGADQGKLVDPKWKVEDGYFEIAPLRRTW